MQRERDRLFLRIATIPVAVSIGVADPLVRELVWACYEAALEKDGAENPVSATLDSGGDGYRVRVSGRPRHSETESVAAVRALNHELLHAVMLRAPHFFYVHAGVVAVAGKAIVIPACRNSLSIAMFNSCSIGIQSSILLI